MTCPHCGEPLTLEHIRTNPECSALIASQCALLSSSKRTKQGGGRPLTVERCPCGAMTAKRAAARAHKC